MFTPIKNTKVYEQVIDQIKEMIKNGTLKRGDKLPSERDLVEQLGVSRASIREALRVLEIIGLLDCRQGEGNFIKSDYGNGLFEPLSVMFMLNESKAEEIFELRRAIETETAALAAKQVTDDELNEMLDLINKMKTSEDEEEMVIYDRKFHYKIAQASRNFLILNILNAVSNLMDSFIKDARWMIIKNHGRANIDFQHEQLWKALKNHNSGEAAEAMRKHLEMINENVIGIENRN